LSRASESLKYYPVNQVFKAAEVARLLRVNRTTVYNLARKGKIPAFRLTTEWRFSQAAIEEWMKKNTRTSDQS
jgi:excisionase family DNA binding protein